jgi:T5SS/PEP-CTERM-associated repeat protein
MEVEMFAGTSLKKWVSSGFPILGVVLVMVYLVSLRSEAAQAASQAATWQYTKIVETGGDFTSVSNPAINDAGDILFNGVYSSGVTGLFLFRGGAIQPVVLVGQAIVVEDLVSGLPVPFGSVQVLDTQDTMSFIDRFGRIYFGAIGTQTGGNLLNLRLEDGVFKQLKYPADFFEATQFVGNANIKTRTLDGEVEIARNLQQEIIDQQPTIMEFRISDGISTRASLLQASQNNNPCGNPSFGFTTPVFNSAGVFFNQRFDFQFCNTGPDVRNTRVVLSGAVSSTLATCQSTAQGPQISGCELSNGPINERGDVLYVKDVYDANSNLVRELHRVLAGGGDELMLSLNKEEAIRRWRILQNGTMAGLFSAEFSSPATKTLTVLSSPGGAEFLLESGQSILGHTAVEPVGFDMNGHNEIAIHYSVLDPSGGTTAEGIAVASSGERRKWSNPNGGNWGIGSNWFPAQAPAANSETIFDLEASYDVQVGTHSAGSSRVENGSVGFRSANLTLLNDLAVGGDASLNIPEGKVKAGGLVVGELPPTNLASAPTARLNILNAGTLLSSTGKTVVGSAGPGELFISGGSLQSVEARIGSGSVGTATVGLPEGFWRTDNLVVGDGVTGTLNIERGALVDTRGQAVIGGGTTVQDRTATVVLDNASEAPTALNWRIIGDLTLGDQLRGKLSVVNGSGIPLFGALLAGKQAHGGSAADWDADLHLEGSDTSGSSPSTLLGFANLILGFESGSRVRVDVLRGAYLSSTRNLMLAFAPGSEVVVTVSGLRGNGEPSLVDIGAVNDLVNTGSCAVGMVGSASLLISQGGVVNCTSQMNIGGPSGSQGYVLVDGKQNTAVSRLKTRFLCIGGAGPICAADNTGVQGVLELRSGARVDASRGTLIGEGGKVTGSGTLSPGELGLAVMDGGVVDPGVSVAAALQNRPVRVAEAAGAVQPGTLTISGSLSISPTGTVQLDLLGPSAGQQDRLVVMGAANLDGTLALKFSNGYAPKQGDVLDLVNIAGAASGAFSSVSITGLAPGFQYDLAASGGKLSLTALNDGVATSSSFGTLTFLPLVEK